ncbi:MAG: CHAT domain-containing protein [Bacteroidia bacterium]
MEIGIMVKGQILARENARITVFMEKVSQANILHLATHAYVDPQNPLGSSIMFHADSGQIEEMPLSRLLGMSIDAEMVVLSACETGAGPWLESVGTLSLGYAFRKAGVKSTLTNLWRSDDESSKHIMVDFYTFLNQGYPKDKALKLARIRFIEEHKNQAHPFFWAGLEINGSNDALSFSKGPKGGRYVLWLVLIVALLAAFSLVKEGGESKMKLIP